MRIGVGSRILPGAIAVSPRRPSPLHTSCFAGMGESAVPGGGSGSPGKGWMPTTPSRPGLVLAALLAGCALQRKPLPEHEGGRVHADPDDVRRLRARLAKNASE